MRVKLALIGMSLIAVSVLFTLVLIAPYTLEPSNSQVVYEIQITHPAVITAPDSRFLLVQFHDDITQREQQDILRRSGAAIVRDGGRDAYIVGMPDAYSPRQVMSVLASRAEVLRVRSLDY